jgi:hypothetical protein
VLADIGSAHPELLMYAFAEEVPCAVVGESKVPFVKPLTKLLQAPVGLGVEKLPLSIGDVAPEVMELVPDPEQIPNGGLMGPDHSNPKPKPPTVAWSAST